MIIQSTEAAAGVDPTTIVGLNEEDAAYRLAADGPNELPTAKPRNLLQQARDVLREPMLLLLVGAGVLYFLLAEPLDGVILMSFVVVVIAITLYQEHKTERALTALRDLSSPRALVVRDGQQQRIAGRDVVRGDVVLLAEGDRVPADGVLIDCVEPHRRRVALTGESVPVRKTARRHRRGRARRWARRAATPRRGCSPARSSSRATASRWSRTGAGTELGRIGNALRDDRTRAHAAAARGRPPRAESSPSAASVAAAVVVVVYGLTRARLAGGLLAGIALAMAMLPEEIPGRAHRVPRARRVAHVATPRAHPPLRRPSRRSDRPPRSASTRPAR